MWHNLKEKKFLHHDLLQICQYSRSLVYNNLHIHIFNRKRVVFITKHHTHPLRPENIRHQILKSLLSHIDTWIEPIELYCADLWTANAIFGSMWRNSRKKVHSIASKLNHFKQMSLISFRQWNRACAVLDVDV